MALPEELQAELESKLISDSENPDLKWLTIGSIPDADSSSDVVKELIDAYFGEDSKQKLYQTSAATFEAPLPDSHEHANEETAATIPLSVFKTDVEAITSTGSIHIALELFEEDEEIHCEFTITLPDDWKISDSYPTLPVEGDAPLFDSLRLEAGAQFILVSVPTTSGPVQGLNFRSNMLLEGVLAPLKDIFPEADEMSLSGGIQKLDNGPVFALAAALPKATIGFFSVVLQVQVITELVLQDGNTEVNATFRLFTELELGVGTTVVEIPIGADFQTELGTLQLVSNLENASSASLTDLGRSLLNGADLLSLDLPDSLHLGDTVSLTDVAVTYDVTSNEIQHIELNIFSPRTWRVFRDIAIKELAMDFAVDTPGDATTRAIAAAMQGAILFGQDTQMNVDAALPDFVVNSSLRDGDTISIVELVNYFLPSSFTLPDGFPDLIIDELSTTIQQDTSVDPPINAVSFAAKAETGTPWTLLPATVIEPVELLNVAFSFTDPGGDANIEGLITGDLQIDTSVIEVSAEVGETLIVRGFLGEGGAILFDINTLIAKFLSDTPPIDANFALTALDFTAEPTQQSFSLIVSIDPAGKWDLGFGSMALGALSARIDYELGNVGLEFRGELEVSNIIFEVAASRPQALFPGDAPVWTFEGGLQDGNEIALTKLFTDFIGAIDSDLADLGGVLPEVVIHDLAFLARPAEGRYAFRGASTWVIPIGGSTSLQVDAGVCIESWTGSTAIPEFCTELSDVSTSTTNTSRQFAALIQGEVSFLGTGADFFNNFSIGASFEIRSGSSLIGLHFKKRNFELNATIPLSSSGVEEIIFDFGDSTFGDVITFVASLFDPDIDEFALLPPWDLMNDISLNGLRLIVNIPDKSFTVSLTGGIIAPLNSIPVLSSFVEFHEIALSFSKFGPKKKLAFTFDISVLGARLPENARTWDPVKQAGPTVPGKGNTILAIHYLGLGQRVSFSESATRDFENIQDALAALRASVLPVDPDQGGLNPLTASSRGLQFNKDSNWLMGIEFSALMTLDFNLIFNDPLLYGLRISFYGDKIPALSGLDFQILYKRVGDTTGVYHIELTLPKAFREMEFGTVKVTLPVVVIDIYTNGDYKLDIGFPWGGNFSRSFGVEAFPFIGSGGFYFNKLSAATATSTPRVSAEVGVFNPVHEFGIGLKIGLGKSFDKGILKAEISVSIRGLVHGVLATFNPTPANQPGDQYHLIRGSVSIVARIYGEVNFVVISASVDITARATVRFLFEAYREIKLVVEAEVKAKAKVSVFGIKVEKSFELEVKEEFFIGENETAPWDRTIPRASVRTLALPSSIAQSGRPAVAGSIAVSAPSGFNPGPPGVAFSMAAPEIAIDPSIISASPIIASDSPVSSGISTELNVLSVEKTTDISALSWRPIQIWENRQRLDLYYQVGYTKAEIAGGGEVKGVSLLFIENDLSDTASDSLKDFNRLAQTMLTWALYAYHVVPEGAAGGSSSATEDVLLSDLPVSRQILQQAFDLFVTRTTDVHEDPSNPFDFDHLEAFLSTNFVFRISEHNASDIDGTVFPFFPHLTMQVGSDPVVDFSSHSTLNDADALKAYFEALTVTLGSSESNSTANSESSALSLASFIFLDYFALLVRGTLQEAINLAKKLEEDPDQQAPRTLATLLDEMDDANCFSKVAPLASTLLMNGFRLPDDPDALDTDTQSLYEVSGQQFGLPLVTDDALGALEIVLKHPVEVELSKNGWTLKNDIAAGFKTAIITSGSGRPQKGDVFQIGDSSVLYRIEGVFETSVAGELSINFTPGTEVAFSESDSVQIMNSFLIALPQSTNQDLTIKEVPGGTDAETLSANTAWWTTGQLGASLRIVFEKEDELVEGWLDGAVSADKELSYQLFLEEIAYIKQLDEVVLADLDAQLTKETELLSLYRTVNPQFAIPNIIAIDASLDAATTGDWFDIPQNLRRYLSELDATGEAIILNRIDADSSIEPIASFEWATRIPIQIQRILDPETGEFLSSIYLLKGANEEDSYVLEDLWNHANTDPSVTLDIRMLSSVPIESGSAESDTSNPDKEKAGFILNHETTANQASIVKTNLSSGSTTLIRSSAGSADSVDFIQLLWEASTVEDGGYFLVVDAAEDPFPDEVFKDGSTGTLVLLIKAHPAQSDRVFCFNNALVVADAALDIEEDTLIAVSLAENHVLEMAPGNQGFALYRKNASFLPENPSAIEELTNLYQHLGYRAGGLEGIPLGPKVDPDSPAGWVVAAVDGTAATVTVKGGLVDPEVGDWFTIEGSDTSYNVSDVADGSGVGEKVLTYVPDATSVFAVDAPVEFKSRWIFERVLPVSKILADTTADDVSLGLPLMSESPYNGIAARATLPVDLFWQDVYGNRLGEDEVVEVDTLPDVSLPVTYFDPLIGINEWPSVTESYTFDQVGGNTLEFKLRFDTNPYVVSSGASDKERTQIEDRIKAAYAQYKSIFYQVHDTNLSVVVSTSVVTGFTTTTDVDGSSVRERIAAFVDAILLFLDAPVSDAIIEHDISISLPGTVNHPSKFIFYVSAGIEFSRPNELVDQSLLSDVPEIERVTAYLSPESSSRFLETDSALELPTEGDVFDVPLQLPAEGDTFTAIASLPTNGILTLPFPRHDVGDKFTVKDVVYTVTAFTSSTGILEYTPKAVTVFEADTVLTFLDKAPLVIAEAPEGSDPHQIGDNQVLTVVPDTSPLLPATGDAFTVNGILFSVDSYDEVNGELAFSPPAIALDTLIKIPGKTPLVVSQVVDAQNVSTFVPGAERPFPAAADTFSLEGTLYSVVSFDEATGTLTYSPAATAPFTQDTLISFEDKPSLLVKTSNVAGADHVTVYMPDESEPDVVPSDQFVFGGITYTVEDYDPDTGNLAHIRLLDELPENTLIKITDKAILLVEQASDTTSVQTFLAGEKGPLPDPNAGDKFKVDHLVYTVTAFEESTSKLVCTFPTGEISLLDEGTVIRILGTTPLIVENVSTVDSGDTTLQAIEIDVSIPEVNGTLTIIDGDDEQVYTVKGYNGDTNQLQIEYTVDSFDAVNGILNFSPSAVDGFLIGSSLVFAEIPSLICHEANIQGATSVKVPITLENNMLSLAVPEARDQFQIDGATYSIDFVDVATRIIRYSQVSPASPSVLVELETLLSVSGKYPFRVQDRPSEDTLVLYPFEYPASGSLEDSAEIQLRYTVDRFSSETGSLSFREPAFRAFPRNLQLNFQRADGSGKMERLGHPLRVNQVDHASATTEVVVSVPHSLIRFAEEFEVVFPGLHLAVSQVRVRNAPTAEPASNAADTERLNESLWAVNLDETKGGISYDILETDPFFFSLAPLATTLITRKVSVPAYSEGVGLVDSEAEQRFDAVDINVLARNFLASFEELLDPSLIVDASTQLVTITDTGETVNFFDELVRCKEKLAVAITDQVTPILENTDLKDDAAHQAEITNRINIAASRLKRELLIDLLQAYDIETIVQFDVQVNASSTLPNWDRNLAPRLVGQPVVVGEESTVPEGVDFTLSSGNIPLTEDGLADLTFFFDTKTPERIEEAELSLSFKLNELEYDIADVDSGISPYQATSWLSFIRPLENNEDLVRKNTMGNVRIAIPLRTYPITPALVFHKAASDPDSLERLQDVRQWSYLYTYEHLDVAQDTIETSVHLNQPNTQTETTGSASGLTTEQQNLFDALITFSQLFPVLEANIRGDEPQTQAYSALLELVRSVANTWSAWSDLTSFTALDNEQAHFEIDENYNDPSREVTITKNHPEAVDFLFDGSDDPALAGIIISEFREALPGDAIVHVEGKPTLIVNHAVDNHEVNTFITGSRGPFPEGGDAFVVNETAFIVESFDEVTGELVFSPSAGTPFPVHTLIKIDEKPALVVVSSVSTTSVSVLIQRTDESTVFPDEGDLFDVNGESFRVTAYEVETGVLVYEPIRVGDPATVDERVFNLVQLPDHVLQENPEPVFGESDVPDRTLIVDNLDVIKHQNAWATVWLSRNKDLLDDSSVLTTNPAFVFRTPIVRFGNMVTPYLVNTKRWNVAKLVLEGETADDVLHDNLPEVARSFAEHLERMFDVILPDSTDLPYDIRTSCEYAFAMVASAVSESEDLITALPVLLGPRFTIPATVDDSINDVQETTTLRANMERDLRTWLATNNPVRTNSRFIFSFSIYSNQDAGGADVNVNLPLLKIEHLELPLDQINDLDSD